MRSHANIAVPGSRVRDDAAVLRGRLASRWERAWAAIEESGYAALLVAGRGVISQYGYLEYVTGYTPIIREGYAFLAAGREPVAILPTAADAHQVRSLVGLDVRIAGGGDLVVGAGDLGTTVAELLREVGADESALGVVGLSSIVPHGDAERLATALMDRVIVDATSLMAELKVLKDVDDIRDLETTAAIVDAGYEVLLQRLRCDTTPWELAGAVHGAIRARGARDALVFVSAGPYLAVPCDPRPLVPGDLVSGLVELVGPGGSWVEFGGLSALGELEPAAKELAGACLEASTTAAMLLRPGTAVARVAAAIDARAEAAAARTGIWHGHGVGVDHDLPLVGSDEERTLEPGMVLAVHPNFTDQEQRVGAMVTDTYVIEEGGPRRLSRIDQRLNQVDV